MKKSVEILGLPIISITEGRELGVSKTLLINAKKGFVTAITIEDEDWYRGVKLIPFESIVVIGDDAIIITSGENILRYDANSEYEALLSANIQIVDTKAITKNGTIQGKISEIFVGDDGKIEKCEVTAPDGTVSEIPSDQVSIFGKQVTMIDFDAKKKSKPESVQPAPENFYETIIPVTNLPNNPPEIPAVEPEIQPEEIPTNFDVLDTGEGQDYFQPEELAAPPDESQFVEEEYSPQEYADEEESPKNQQAEALKAALKRAMESSQQKNSRQAPATPKKSSTTQQKKPAFDEKRRLMLLGKKAARTIKADTGAIIVEAGAEITEEVLQKARLANKFIDLSMNYVP